MNRGIDWDAELARAVRDGETASEVARRLGVSPPVVYEARRARGVTLPMGCKARRNIDWDAEAARALGAGETEAEMSRRLDVSRRAVSKALRRRGLRLARGATAVRGIDWDAELARAVRDGETQAELARRLGASETATAKARRRRGVTLATGEVIRPDAFVINDPQTREAALSPKQIKDRIDIVSADLLGMGGPGKPMRGVMTMTVISKNDLADRVLGPEFPQWRSIRGKWLQKWPTNMRLWSEYGALLRRVKAEAGDMEQVNDFYRTHRESRFGLGWQKPGLDFGAKIYWESRVNPPYLTSLQSFMSWWTLDPDAAMAEGQNEPQDPHEPQDITYCSREQILEKQSALERFEVPNDASELVVFIDLQLEVLIYCVMAITPDFRRYVVDYGTFPDQQRDYWTKQQLSHRLSTTWDSPKQAWVEGLRILTQILGKTEWRKSNGQRVQLSMGTIDASWGDSTDSVFQFCRESGSNVWFPSFGVGIGPNSNELNHGSEQKAWQKRHVDWGPHWHRRSDHDRGHDAFRYDANFFKSFVHDGIATPEQEPRSLQFFQGNHEMLADHLRAEWPDKKSGRGREMVVWEVRVGKPDNDFFDCVSGCGMVGSARKIAIPGMEGFGANRKKAIAARHWTQGDFE